MPTAFRFDADGAWIQKDPADALDYALPWADWLAGDTLQTVTWTVPAGLTKDSQSVNLAPVTVDGVEYAASTVATVWLSGGTPGEIYTITCRVVTAGGRTTERDFRVVVVNRVVEPMR